MALKFLYKSDRRLSRGKWSFGAGSPKGKHWPPLRKRGNGNIEKAGLKHDEKGQREILAVVESEPNEVAEIKCEGHFCDRKKRFERHVFAFPPRLRTSWRVATMRRSPKAPTIALETLVRRA